MGKYNPSNEPAQFYAGVKLDSKCLFRPKVQYMFYGLLQRTSIIIYAYGMIIRVILYFWITRCTVCHGNGNTGLGQEEALGCIEPGTLEVTEQEHKKTV